MKTIFLFLLCFLSVTSLNLRMASISHEGTEVWDPFANMKDDEQNNDGQQDEADAPVGTLVWDPEQTDPEDGSNSGTIVWNPDGKQQKNEQSEEQTYPELEINEDNQTSKQKEESTSPENQIQGTQQNKQKKPQDNQIINNQNSQQGNNVPKSQSNTIYTKPLKFNPLIFDPSTSNVADEAPASSTATPAATPTATATATSTFNTQDETSASDNANTQSGLAIINTENQATNSQDQTINTQKISTQANLVPIQNEDSSFSLVPLSSDPIAQVAQYPLQYSKPVPAINQNNQFDSDFSLDPLSSSPVPINQLRETSTVPSSAPVYSQSSQFDPIAVKPYSVSQTNQAYSVAPTPTTSGIDVNWIAPISVPPIPVVV